MIRATLLKILAPAVMAVGGVPAIASAHSHVTIGFGFCGFFAPPAAYCAPAYVAPAPAVVYVPAPAPVVVAAPVACPAPPVVYSAPTLVYTQPAIVVVPAPTVVYSTGYYYQHPYFYDHVRWYRR